jgi:Ca2+-binding EF-hand superfamily protein
MSCLCCKSQTKVPPRFAPTGAASSETDSRYEEEVKRMYHIDLREIREKTSFGKDEMNEVFERFKKVTQGKLFIEQSSFHELIFFNLEEIGQLSSRIFKSLDVNQDGNISFEEYIYFFNTLLYGDARSRALVSFQIIDQDHKGYIKIEDVTEMVCEMLESNNIQRKLSESLDLTIEDRAIILAESFYFALDPSKIGKVGFEQFYITVQRDRSLLDFFSLVLNGLSDAFIQKNIERLKIESFLIRVKDIEEEVSLVSEALKVVLAYLQSDKIQEGPVMKNQNYRFNHQNLNNLAHHAGDLKKSHFLAGLETVNHLRLARNYQPHPNETKPPTGESGARGKQVTVPGPKPSIFQEDLIPNRIDPDRSHAPVDPEWHLPMPQPKQIESEDDAPAGAMTIEAVRGAGARRYPLYVDQAMQTPHLQDFVRKGYRTTPAKEENRNNLVPDEYMGQLLPYESCLKAEAMLQSIASKLAILKENLQDDQDKIRNQVGGKVTVAVKKNMGQVSQDNSTKNNLLFILHEKWSLMASMMIGIQKSINSLGGDVGEPSTKDFKLMYRFELRPAQVTERDTQEDSYSGSVFYDYAPVVFNEIRRMFGISNKLVRSCYVVS